MPFPTSPSVTEAVLCAARNVTARVDGRVAKALSEDSLSPPTTSHFVHAANDDPVFARRMGVRVVAQMGMILVLEAAKSACGETDEWDASWLLQPAELSMVQHGWSKHLCNTIQGAKVNCTFELNVDAQGTPWSSKVVYVEQMAKPSDRSIFFKFGSSEGVRGRDAMQRAQLCTFSAHAMRHLQKDGSGRIPRWSLLLDMYEDGAINTARHRMPVQHVLGHFTMVALISAAGYNCGGAEAFSCGERRHALVNPHMPWWLADGPLRRVRVVDEHDPRPAWCICGGRDQHVVPQS